MTDKNYGGPGKPTYTEVPHFYAEYLAKIKLTQYESRILWVIIRQTLGWHKEYDTISYSQFEQKTGLDRKSVNRTLKNLIDKGHIESKPVPHSQQIQYRLIMPEPVATEPMAIRGQTSGKIAPQLVAAEPPTKDNTKDIQKISIPAGTPAGPKLSKKAFITKMQNLLNFLEEQLTYPKPSLTHIPNQAEEFKSFKKMMARGFTEDQIFKTWDDKVCFLGEFVSMTYVEKHIGEEQETARI